MTGTGEIDGVKTREEEQHSGAFKHCLMEKSGSQSGRNVELLQGGERQ